jgi:hypothetical protein
MYNYIKQEVDHEYTTYIHSKTKGLYFPLQFGVSKMGTNIDMDYYFKLTKPAFVEETMEEVDIYFLYSDGMGIMGYFHDGDLPQEGEYVLYKGTDWKMWLRPTKEWEEVIGTQPSGMVVRRFEKLKGEMLFDEVARQMFLMGEW